MDKKDSSLVDWSKPVESPQLQTKANSKKKSAKLKRIQQELKKCMGSEKFDEAVVKSYSCAWQKDILIQGRLHLTQNWICFYSSILGWETKTNISLKEVTSISKQRTALVFPNAILVEAGDRKYGFASFVHRDRSYTVMEVIWHNSQLQQPCSSEALKGKLSQLAWQERYSGIGSRAKSSSFTGDSSDLELSSSAHSPSHSTPYISRVGVTQVTASDSDWGTEDGDQVDGELYRTEHLELHSSTCSSDASEESSVGSCHTPQDDPGQMSDVDISTETTSQSNDSLHKRNLNKSPSLLTLKPFMSEASVIQSEAILGGSPNFLHHWKQTLSIATIWQTVVTLVKPQHLAHMCSPSRLISVLIILFISLLLLSTVSMFCQLSKVEPTLQPYLGWQPWCSLCTAKSNGPQL